MKSDMLLSPIRKPAWLPRLEYEKYVSFHRSSDEGWKCQICFVELGRENSHWDHIQPRSLQGEDRFGNVQLLCATCNRKKYNKPDPVWSEPNYFDQPLHVHNLRISQLHYIYRVLSDDYSGVFGQPISYYAGKLFLFPQIVGAGKTLGGFVAPFAINECRNLRGQGLPRIRKVLFLCKDKSLRDQIAQELSEEPLKYNLIEEKPRVLKVEGSDDLRDFHSLNRYDIAVSCIASVWDDESRKFDENERIRMLAQFEMINIDECHFAHGADKRFTQVARIVARATQSICIGLTASPINREGEVLHAAIRMPVFGYNQASKHDNSMKGLGDSSYLGETADCQIAAKGYGWRRFDENGERETDAVGSRDIELQVLCEREKLSRMYRDIIHTVHIDEVEIDEGDWTKFDAQLDSDAIRRGLVVPRGVASKVLMLMQQRDSLLDLTDDDLLLEKKARHRPESAVVGPGYYTHAIIRVEGILEAEQICKWLNNKFESERKLYPRERGWRAECAHGGSSKHGFEEKTLDSEHPWFRYRNQRGRIDSQCARILVVCDLAKEGINNMYCGIIGMGCRENSLRNKIQIIGRAIRSTHRFGKNDAGETVLLVPPRMFDELQIVEHEAFTSPGKDDWQTAWALQFMEHMESNTSTLETIAEFARDFDTEVVCPEDDDDEFAHMSYLQRLVALELAARKIFDSEKKLTTKQRAQIIAKCNGPSVGGQTDANGNVKHKLDTFHKWFDLCERSLLNDDSTASKLLTSKLKIKKRVERERVARNDKLDVRRVSREERQEFFRTYFASAERKRVEAGIELPQSVFDLYVDTFYDRHMIGCHAGEFTVTRKLMDVVEDQTDRFVEFVASAAESSRKEFCKLVHPLLMDSISLAIDTVDIAESSANVNQPIVTYFATDNQCMCRMYGYVVYHLAVMGVLRGVLLCCRLKEGKNSNEQAD